MVIPKGKVKINTSHGPEYTPTSEDFKINCDTSIVIILDRIADMNEKGWYSEDCHIHINHGNGDYTLSPEDAHLIGRGEGLNVVNCLDNGYYFTGVPADCSTSDCIVYMSEEFRSHVMGHMGLLGLSSEIYPWWSGWYPLFMDVADSVHTQPGAIVVSAHPISFNNFKDIHRWPGSGLARELPIDIIEDRIDAFEVMSYSNYHSQGVELDFWYSLLNCGSDISACAGTDAIMNAYCTNSPGQFRTYAYLNDIELSFCGWLDAVAEGRTFVTNGPLIYHFTARKQMPGAREYGPGEKCRL